MTFNDVELGTKRKNPFPVILEDDEIAVKSISKCINWWYNN